MQQHPSDDFFIPSGHDVTGDTVVVDEPLSLALHAPPLRAYPVAHAVQLQDESILEQCGIALSRQADVVKLLPSKEFIGSISTVSHFSETQRPLSSL